MTQEHTQSNGNIAFALVYLTFFLDNVLLTVLVPIIPDWIRGESLTLWAAHDAPLAKLLNSTVQRVADEEAAGSVGMSQAGVGAVLGAKAAAQLLAAPAAATFVARRGPAPALRLATALLAAAAIVFACCAALGAGGDGGDGGGGGGVGGGAGAACAGGGRAVQGAGAALGGVAGLALGARALPPARRARALAALLGAVALGVLVGYPFGGIAYVLWSPGAPFQLIAVALLANLALQYMFLNREEYNQASEEEDEEPCEAGAGGGWGAWGWRGVRAAAAAREGAAGACAGAVLVTTSVMAALEPCLPLWIATNFHPQRWALGAAFLPDSAGYLVAASALGGVARAIGAERVALGGLLAVGLAALAVPAARSVAGLALPQMAVGAGLGACDAALVPALLARRRVPHTAALLQAASSAAYALGPVVGGVVSWAAGFEAAMRALGVANLLYAAYLYRVLRAHPLSSQWGARDESADSEDEELPLGAHHYSPHP